MTHPIPVPDLPTDLPTAQAIVCDYLHYDGSCRDVLAEADWNRVYCMADGFGPVGEAALEINDGYDWSHVRDSSPDAWLAMANEIARIVNAYAEVWVLRPPHTARFARVMNLAAQLRLPWDEALHVWTTSSRTHMLAMRKAGAIIEAA